MDKLANLNQQQQDLVNKAQELNDNIEDCGKKLVRAEKMISGLEGEKVRWTETVEKLNVQKGFLVGDSLIAAGMVSYSGPFISQYREDLERLWRDKAAELGIKVTENCTMRDVLGNDVQIRTWAVAGLPSDNLSVENGIIMFGSRRWPLMIDPQTQANKFIKKLGGMQEDTQLEVLKLSETNLIRSLELAIQFGKWVLLENIGEELDPALEPILLQQLTKQGTNYTIKIGERVIQYSFGFKFFMTTTLPNPHYSPETSVKVTILNLSITPKGLEEQMLNLFCTFQKQT